MKFASYFPKKKMVIMIQSCCYNFNLCFQTDKMSIHCIQYTQTMKEQYVGTSRFLGDGLNIQILSASISYPKPFQLRSTHAQQLYIQVKKLKVLCTRYLRKKSFGTLKCPCDQIFGIPHWLTIVGGE